MSPAESAILRAWLEQRIALTVERSFPADRAIDLIGVSPIPYDTWAVVDRGAGEFDVTAVFRVRAAWADPPRRSP